jgi:hypothetical protein
MIGRSNNASRLAEEYRETSAIRVARTFVFADIDVERNREHALGSSFLCTLYEKKAR